MSIATLRKSIRERFKEKVVTGLSLPTQFDNGKMPTKTTRDIWCRFTIKSGDSFQSEFGSDTVKERTSGTVYAQLFSPPNMGDKGLTELGDSIANQFRRVTADGVKYLTPSVLNIGFNGTYYQVNVKIPFTYSADKQKGSV